MYSQATMSSWLSLKKFNQHTMLILKTVNYTTLFAQLSFVKSSRVHCPIHAMQEIQQRMIPLCKFSITHKDFRLSHGPINMPQLVGSNHESVTGCILSAMRKHESSIAAIIDDLPLLIDPAE